MKRRSMILCTLAACVLGLVWASSVIAETPASQPSSSGTAKGAGWTDTTTKSATTPEQKAVLDAGKPATISGELVEVSCFLQLGKRGAAHIPCGTDCFKNGQPAGIVDKDGKLTILFVEAHDPRRYGQADIRDKYIELLAKQVTATGMLTRSKDGVQSLYIKPADLKVQ